MDTWLVHELGGGGELAGGGGNGSEGLEGACWRCGGFSGLELLVWPGPEDLVLVVVRGGVGCSSASGDVVRAVGEEKGDLNE